MGLCWNSLSSKNFKLVEYKLELLVAIFPNPWDSLPKRDSNTEKSRA